MGRVTVTFRGLDLVISDVEPRRLEPPSAEPLGAPIMTRSQVSFATDDGQVLCGAWECEPGRSRWEFLDRGEFIHVLAGSMTVERDGEAPQLLTPGTSAVFPIGWCGVWTVHQT